MIKMFKFIVVLIASLFFMFLCAFQASAEHHGECMEYCSSNETVCLENTPAMEPIQQHARKAVCAKQREECLSACTPQLTPSQDAEGAQVDKVGSK